MAEPFKLSLFEIARLTDDQLTNIYFCERDENGNPVERDTRPKMSIRQICYKIWRMRQPDITEEQLKQKFEEWKVKSGGR